MKHHAHGVPKSEYALINRYYGDVINTGKEIDERIIKTQKKYQKTISKCSPIASDINRIIFIK